MTSRTEGAATVSPAADRTAEPGDVLRLTRSISATWWYMFLAVVAFELTAVVLAVLALAEDGHDLLTLVGVGTAGVLWWLATLLPLAGYRHRAAGAPLAVGRRHAAPLLMGVAYGLTIGAVTGLWTLGLLPVLQAAMLLSWPRGVRFRVVLAATVLLVLLWVIDGHRTLDGDGWAQVVFMCVVLPAMTVSSLWSWDVLVALDRARTSEARLAATQERLRLATDVHDLQGHHLQVIALQLELAERLMPGDPDAGLAQLRAARASVDDARQGTRDLATRFRSVPLADELANAVDLLRAAGARADAVVDPDAALAPASALGPVVRETTTNVLRHGGGHWAWLALTRADGVWRYEIANDAADVTDGDGADGTIRGPAGTVADAAADTAGRGALGGRSAGGGAGLEGIARRAAEAGGDLAVRHEAGTFTVVVTVPADPPGGPVRRAGAGPAARAGTGPGARAVAGPAGGPVRDTPAAPAAGIVDGEGAR